MEKVIFFALAVPILGFVFYLGGTAIMKVSKQKLKTNQPNQKKKKKKMKLKFLHQVVMILAAKLQN